MVLHNVGRVPARRAPPEAIFTRHDFRLLQASGKAEFTLGDRDDSLSFATLR